MLRNKRYQNSIKTMAAYPGVDIGSDYNDRNTQIQGKIDDKQKREKSI